MNMQRVVDILKTEKECVTRNENGECDRKCFDCNLVLPSKEILQAYTLAIGCIEGFIADNEVDSWVDEVVESMKDTKAHVSSVNPDEFVDAVKDLEDER